MRPFRFALFACCLATLLVCLFSVGCGGWLREDDDELPGSVGPKGTGPTKAALKPIKATKFADITGKVKWEGDAPENKALTFSKDQDQCNMGSEYEKVDNSFWVGGKGKDRLGNVFVWLEAPKGFYFEVPKEQLAAFNKTSVTIHQPHCAFVPHCAVLFPQYYKDGTELANTGQELVVLNDAKVAHNAKIVNTGGGNPSLVPDSSAKFVLDPDDSVTSVSCGVHPWMQGYLRVFAHPYAAVTSVGQNPDPKKKPWQDRTADNFGTYVIKGAPVGAKVTIVAWHESLQDVERRTITVKEGGQVEDFTAKKK